MPNEKDARRASDWVWELRRTENFLPWGETNLYSKTNQPLAQALQKLQKPACYEKNFSEILSTVWLDQVQVWIWCGKIVGVGLNVGKINVLANSRAQCTCVENKTNWALRPKEIDTEEIEERGKARELLGTQKAEECRSVDTRRRHVITFSKHTRQKRESCRERKTKQLRTYNVTLWCVRVDIVTV